MNTVFSYYFTAFCLFCIHNQRNLRCLIHNCALTLYPIALGRPFSLYAAFIVRTIHNGINSHDIVQW
jgi:hypothetical protein